MVVPSGKSGSPAGTATEMSVTRSDGARVRSWSMNWPQAYIMPDRPWPFGVAASPSPTTTLLTVRGFGPPTICDTPSA
jgi:hypothetical protein